MRWFLVCWLAAQVGGPQDQRNGDEERIRIVPLFGVGGCIRSASTFVGGEEVFFGISAPAVPEGGGLVASSTVRAADDSVAFRVSNPVVDDALIPGRTRWSVVRIPPTLKPGLYSLEYELQERAGKVLHRTTHPFQVRQRSFAIINLRLCHDRDGKYVLGPHLNAGEVYYLCFNVIGCDNPLTPMTFKASALDEERKPIRKPVELQILKNPDKPGELMTVKYSVGGTRVGRCHLVLELTDAGIPDGYCKEEITVTIHGRSPVPETAAPAPSPRATDSPQRRYHRTSTSQ